MIKPVGFPTNALDLRYSLLLSQKAFNCADILAKYTGLAIITASAFATLENDGKYREPTCIVMIMNSRGETIVGDNIEEKAIYDQNAARTMTDVLTGVLIRGTGAKLKLNNMAAAGKTGTTNDKKDGWFVGYTPYYTTSVWVGYDIPRTVSDLYGSTYPGTIWKTYMNEIHEGLANKGFEGYTSVEEETVEPEELEGEIEEDDAIAEEVTTPENQEIPEDELPSDENMEIQSGISETPSEGTPEEPEEEEIIETTPEEPEEPFIPEDSEGLETGE